MTRRLRVSDMRFAADVAPTKPEGDRRGSPNTGIANEWLGNIRTPTAVERDRARRYLLANGHADLVDVLGLAT